MEKLISCLFLPVLFFAIHAPAQKQPNILWITIEDTSPEFIGCYGNADARTPNIDMLTREGVRFTSAYATGTVCSPSRTTLITGVRTFEAGNGHHRSEFPLPANMPGFPMYMRQAGYLTTNNNKTDYNVPEMRAFASKAWNQNSGTAGWQNRRPGQPFFSVFNFIESHQSRTMTDPYSKYKAEVFDQLSDNEQIGDNSFKVPPIYHDSPEMRKQLARVYNSLRLTDKKIGELLTRLEKDQLRDSTIIFFFSDHGQGIPRGKTNGINLGYRCAFSIWFPEMYRHLSPWGHGGIVTDELISFEDLAPTLISLANGTVPAYMKGRILVGPGRSKPVPFIELSSDRSDNGIDMVRSITDGRFMYSRNFMPFMPEERYINYMEIADIKKQIRADQASNRLNPFQQSLLEEREPEFLFDLKADPWETMNLARNPQLKLTLRELRSRLDSMVLASRDVMFLPEYELAEVSKTATPYEFRLSDARYPIGEIYKAASLSGFRSKAIAARQAPLLNHENKVVSYWAALGLRSQHPAELSPYKNIILDKIDNSYLPLAVTASAIAYDVFGDKKAEENLKKWISDPNPYIALMTVNYLLYVKNKTPFAGLVKEKNNGEANYMVKWAYEDFLSALK
ncbi:MAG TPA: sulfatase [Chitinophagaceae bacterium]|nr:sulfatase [Chitinophagaceae bacterium]